MFLLYQDLWNFNFFPFSDETLFLVKSYLEAQHIKQRCLWWMGAGGEGELQVYSPHLPWPSEFFGDTPRECLRFSGATYDTCNNHFLIRFIRLFFFTSHLLGVYYVPGTFWGERKTYSLEQKQAKKKTGCVAGSGGGVACVGSLSWALSSADPWQTFLFLLCSFRYRLSFESGTTVDLKHPSSPIFSDLVWITVWSSFVLRRCNIPQCSLAAIHFSDSGLRRCPETNFCFHFY